MITEAFDAANAPDFAAIGFFILGHPNETPESIAQTIRLAVRVNPGMPIFGVMVRIPERSGSARRAGTRRIPAADR